MDATKQVTIGGTEYQIGRFTAREGSWVLAQLATKMLPGMIEQEIGVQGLAATRPSISEDEFNSLQALALSVCRKMQNGAPVPIFVRPDKWAVKELEYDFATVAALTVHAMSFNIASFFVDGGLQQILSSFSLGRSLS
jgi:hypothetical protein